MLEKPKVEVKSDKQLNSTQELSDKTEICSDPRLISLEMKSGLKSNK